MHHKLTSEFPRDLQQYARVLTSANSFLAEKLMKHLFPFFCIKDCHRWPQSKGVKVQYTMSWQCIMYQSYACCMQQYVLCKGICRMYLKEKNYRMWFGMQSLKACVQDSKVDSCCECVCVWLHSPDHLFNIFFKIWCGC